MSKAFVENIERKQYIDLLAVISAIAVVYLHVNHFFWTFSYGAYWFLANVQECVFYFGVPVFFMISGATLIDYGKKYSTKIFFLRRLIKVVIPFLFWSLFGLLFALFITKSEKFDNLSLTYIINGIINYKFVYIYWFFMPLFILYLTIPFLAQINEKNRVKSYSYLVVLIVLNIFISFMVQVYSIKITFDTTYIKSLGAILYALIGYILSKTTFTKKQIAGLAVLGLAGLIVHIFGTYYESISAGEIIKTYKGYYNIPCIFYSTAIFVIVKNIADKLFENKYFAYIVKFLKKYTFSIYLLHWYVLQIINPDYKLIFTRFGLPLIIIPICILIAYFIHKIPVLKKILP